MVEQANTFARERTILTVGMFGRRRKRVIIAAVVGLVLLIAAGLEIRRRVRVPSISVITGVVIAAHEDPELQRAVSKATVVARSGTTTGEAVSEASGLFRVQLQPPAPAGETLQIEVTHPDFEPAAISAPAGKQMPVIRMTRAPVPVGDGEQADIRISNIRVRYTTRASTTTTVGTAVRTFTIRNKANVPCDRQPPCSPDRRWKATVQPLTLDAGEHKQFRNVHVSCMAGPCPFSAIASDRFSRGGRVITVSVINWSDPVTYLVEAEVVQTMNSEIIGYTYPAIFARSMNITLPPDATGVSIEADVDGMPITFPLGPELKLSWAACRLQTGSDKAKQIRCELKPGYRLEE